MNRRWRLPLFGYQYPVLISLPAAGVAGELPRVSSAKIGGLYPVGKCFGQRRSGLVVAGSQVPLVL